MHRYWSGMLRPILAAARPGVTVEIGAGDGFNTRRLLELTGVWNGAVHAVDPLPRFPADDWEREYGARFRFHREMSHGALARIGRADAYLIDGDHNWHTVRGELESIGRSALADPGRPFPLVFLHATGWPYGRRDCYDDPRALPPEFVQRFRKAGVIPGRAGLADGAGLYPERNHAMSEGGARNGVLTALEDFLRDFPGEGSLELAVLRVPAFEGLAIVTGAAALERSPELAALLDQLRAQPLAAGVLDALEQARAAAEVAVADERRRRSDERAAQVAELRQNTQKTEERSRRMKRELARWRVLAEFKARADARVASHALGGIVPGIARAMLNATDRRDAREGIDAAWYRRTYPDVAATGVDPAAHYVQCGVFEGRDPAPGFSTVDYLLGNPDVVAAGINPLLHYTRLGATEGRKATPSKERAPSGKSSGPSRSPGTPQSR